MSGKFICNRRTCYWRAKRGRKKYCTILLVLCNRKGAKRRGGAMVNGREAGLNGTGSGMFGPSCPLPLLA